MGESVDLLDGARRLEGWWGSEGGWHGWLEEATSVDMAEPVRSKRVYQVKSCVCASILFYPFTLSPS